MLEKAYSESELVFGLIGATGTDLGKVRKLLEDRLNVVGYDVVQVKITRDVIPQIIESKAIEGEDQFNRTMRLMDAGNEARRRSEDNSILALGAAAFINATRKKNDDGVCQPASRKAYIISSLKHPDEVKRLRAIYPHGFYLIGVYSNSESRFKFLMKDERVSEGNAGQLMERDENEDQACGQKVLETFHLSDFFLRVEEHETFFKESIWRILDLLFGNPYVTPTFDEFAMYLAFAASLSSADLSRQVGAVVALDDEVVATGANDCPKAFGGRYWPERNEQTHRIEDVKGGRDYMRDGDSNKIEKNRIN